MSEIQCPSIVFIDATLPDLATLQAGLPQNVEIHLLDPQREGLQQVAAVLENRSDIASLHLITHGAPGKLFIGNSAVDRNILRNSRGELEAISNAMAEDGELLIYGCEVAAGREGGLFVDALTKMTGLKVAAATHKVGHSALQGSWALDAMPAGMMAQPVAVNEWRGVLATFDLTSASGASSNTVKQTVGSDEMVLTAESQPFSLDGELSILNYDHLDLSGTIAAAGEIQPETKVTITVTGGKTFNLDSFAIADIFSENKTLVITSDKGAVTYSKATNRESWLITTTNSNAQGVSWIEITTNDGSKFSWAFDNLVLSNITATGPAITYSAATFVEAAANDGSITASITLTLANDTYTGTDGQALAGAVVTNVPAGLTAVVTKTSATVATVTFTGSAAAHANANDVSNLTITLGDAAFTGGSAAAVSNATKSDLVIDFADPAPAPAAPVIDLNGTADGFNTEVDEKIRFGSDTVINITDTDSTELKSITVSFAPGDELDWLSVKNPVGSDYYISLYTGKDPHDHTTGYLFVNTQDFSFATVNDGGIWRVTYTSVDYDYTPTPADLSVFEDLLDNMYCFQGEGVLSSARTFSITATDAEDNVTTTPAQIVVNPLPKITRDSSSERRLNEDSANDGSIANSVVYNLTGDTFLDANSDGKVDGVTFDGVPAGLTASLAYNSPTRATLTLTGTATAHTNDDDTEIQVIFSASSFAGGATVSDYFNDAEKQVLAEVDFTDGPPAFVSGVVVGDRVRLTYSLDLYDDSLDTANFIVKAGDSTIAVTNAFVDGDDPTVVVLELESAVPAGATVTFAYNDPSEEDDESVIESDSENIDAVTMAATEITNNTAILNYDVTTLNESAANNGSITEKITVTATGVTFAGTNGQPLAAVTVNNVPNGLTAVVTQISSTTAEISFTGNASAHANSNDIDTLEVVFNDEALSGSAASDVINATKSDLEIDFADPAAASATPVIDLNGATDGINKTATYFVGSTTASFFADGAITNISDSDSTHLKSLSVSIPTASIKEGDSLSFAFSSTTIAIDGSGTASGPVSFHVPLPFNYAVTTNGDDRIITFTPPVNNTSTLANFETLLDRMYFKTTNTDALTSRVFSVSVTDESDHVAPAATFTVTTALAPAITYSAATFAESPANNGSITASITLTLTNDTYTGTNGEALAGAVVTNVPAGLTAVVTKTSDTVATVTFTGNAAAHANANDVTNLTITLGNAAFTGGSAAAVTNATKSDLAIDFADPTSSGGSSTPAPAPGTFTTVDGATVTTSTTTTTDGRVLDVVTITPISDNRQESTGDASRADIALYYSDSAQGVPATTASLPTGVGLTSTGIRTPANNTEALANLITLVNQTAGSTENNRPDMVSGGESFLARLEQQADKGPLIVNSIKLTVAPGQTTAPDKPITITGSSVRVAQGSGNGNGGAPVEALVIDTRALPPGTVLELKDIEFAVIIGDNVTVRGGEGANIVFAGSGPQNIVLGEDDDELSGGDGDDIIGSTGGNDLINGDAGNDWLVGGVGNDTLNGGDGNDLLHGGASDAGTYRFSLNEAGKVRLDYSATHADMAQAATAVIDGQWWNANGQLALSDARFAFVGADGNFLQDVALLYQAIVKQLPSVADLNAWVASGKTQAELTQIAWDAYQSLQGPGAQALEVQVAQLIQHVWGGTADPALVQAGVNHLNQGGNWGDALLYLARHENNSNAIKDTAGRIKLAKDWNLKETGWSGDGGNDQLFGGAGNDVLVAGSGNNLLDGGAGTDLAVFFGHVNDWQVLFDTAGQVIVSNRYSGAQNVIRDIELFQFGDTVFGQVKSDHPTIAQGVNYAITDFLAPASDNQIALIGVADWTVV